MTSIAQRNVWHHPNSIPLGKGNNDHSFGFLTKKLNAKDVLVIQPNDWQRMQNAYSKYSAEKEIKEAQKRERFANHEKSKELVKHWENTIDGQRLKKLQARNIREEQEEKERQKIDIEEAKLQAEKRKVAIERAKQLQYFETDRVKGFHGALLLTEVLKERDAQIEMKNEKLNWQKERDAYLVEQQRKNYDAAMQAEHEKAKARFDRAFDIAQFQKEQVQDKERRLNLEKEDGIKEGQCIEEQNHSFVSARKALDKRRRDYKTVLMATHKDDIATKNEIQNQEKLKEEMADADIKKFVDAKRKMAAMRRNKEHELFEAFQNHTEQMRNKLKAEIQQKVDDEDERIARTVAEREKKRLEELERKQQAENDNHEATKQQRLQMIADAKKRQETNLLRGKAYLEQKMNEDKEFKTQIKEDDAKQRLKACSLQTFHKNQIIERGKKVKDERTKEIESDIRDMNALVKEENVFQDYAKRVVDDAKSHGRNPFPLVKAHTEGPGGGRGPKFEGNAGLRPSYIVADATGVQLPHYTKDETIYNRVYGHVGKSTNRLGFTWSR